MTLTDAAYAVTLAVLGVYALSVWRRWQSAGESAADEGRESGDGSAPETTGGP